jgi:hypothetical protein
LKWHWHHVNGDIDSSEGGSNHNCNRNCTRTTTVVAMMMAIAMAMASVSATAAVAMTALATKKASRTKGWEEEHGKPGLRDCGNLLMRRAGDATTTIMALQVALNII